MNMRPALRFLILLPFLVFACTDNAGRKAPVSGTAISKISTVSSQWPLAFVLPFDDASTGITHMGERLNHKPAGTLGPLRINDEGHFVTGEQRIKFWGVNIVGAACFPSHQNAKKVAAHLARFGVNIVRFHHMEHDWWGESLIDYSTGNSRKLDDDNLDKLDFFVAELKKQGIYTNLNLLTARQYSPSDGLPESITKLDWKQRHILGYILPHARVLEKEHAASILTHLNPYTGISYAADPAVAIVEINNENSIYQQFLDGSIDIWPENISSLLEQKWNNWIAAKYQSTNDLEYAWGVIDQKYGKEKVVNGNFNAGLRSWNLEQHQGASASALKGSYGGRPGLRIKVGASGGSAWHVQMNQAGLSFSEGQIYTLSFWAKSIHYDEVSLALQQANIPWQMYDSLKFKLNKNWQKFSFSLIAGFTDSDARLNFTGLGAGLGSLDIADVSVKEGGKLGQLPEGEKLENKNISINKFSERYTAARNLDWSRFLLSLEQEYWADMRSYLEKDLGIVGLAYGTIVSLSPPSIQQQFGFIDAHTYWRHPHFPGRAWDRNNWTVQNDSLVNTVGNTLDVLSKQRVAGLPFTVSEYQHAMPNFYMAESALLIGAYGALQDWDGVYFFAYGAHRNDNWEAGFFNGYFDTGNNPSAMANLAIAANMFRRGDVAAAKKMVRINFSPEIEMRAVTKRGRAWGLATGNQLDIPPGTAFVNRLALDTSNNPSGLDKAPVLSSTEVLVSDTRELRWDTTRADEGVVSVNTDKTISLVGYIGGKGYELGDIRVEFGKLNLGWATFTASTQSGSLAQLDQAASIFVVATARTENTNMQWTDDSFTSVGANWGEAPTLIETVPFSLDIPRASTDIQAWALDDRGQRSSALEIQDTAEGARIVVPGNIATLWYEIEIP